ncbi:hypothetical protein [Streptomyces liliiviolaceus]|uniref:hypothetical protein n=1 Tax=Streptomyces liliiviolaceus TaxID=2823109 RepID=UPI001FFC972C|nr:hypothetical protein [Streptomyces liliiviolaceus]
MTSHPIPLLKSSPGTPTGTGPAEPAAPATGPSAPKVVAEGVRTAVSPDQHRGDGRYPVAWLSIVAPRGAVPTATSKCLCGRDRSAVGRAKVLALITDHEAHRDTCPLRTPQEGRAAA